MTADQCSNMNDVRQEIDKINSELLKLLATRQTYVERAAELKTNIADIPAPHRRAEIIESIQIQAKDFGLDTHVATTIFNSMIDAFIDLEIQKHIETK